jgi:hypothetical protein
LCRLGILIPNLITILLPPAVWVVQV